jgi:hypothetical protein
LFPVGLGVEGEGEGKENPLGSFHMWDEF